jgi:hypothetical protein
MNSAAQVGTRHVPVLKIPTEAHWSVTRAGDPMRATVQQLR